MNAKKYTFDLSIPRYDYELNISGNSVVVTECLGIAYLKLDDKFNSPIDLSKISKISNATFTKLYISNDAQPNKYIEFYVLTEVDIDRTALNLNELAFAVNEFNEGLLSYLDSLKIVISNTNSQLNTLDINVSEISQTSDQISLTVAQLQSSIDTINSNVASLIITASSITSTVSSIESDVDSISTSVSQIQQTASSISSTVSTVSSNVDTISTNISQIQQTANSISSTVSSIQATSNTISSKVSTIEQTANSITSTVSQINTTLSNTNTTTTGLLIERATTNKIATEGNAAQNWQNWSHWNNTRYWYTSEQYDDPVMGKVYRGKAKNQTSIFDYFPYSVIAGQYYTLSVYVKASTTKTTTITGKIVKNDYSNVDLQSKQYTITPQWQKIEFTIQASETLSSTAGIAIDFGTGWDGVILEFAYPQFENLGFSTTFVNGTRSIERLNYSSSVINPSTGTFECWVYIPDTFSSDYSDNDGILLWTNTTTYYPVITVTLSLSTKKVNFITRNSSNQTTQITSSTLSSGLHYIAASWSSTINKLYVDGVLVASANSPYVCDSVTTCAIGHIPNHSSYVYKLIFKSIRISNIQRTDAEIQSSYTAGFINDGYTTLLVDYVNSINDTIHNINGTFVRSSTALNQNFTISPTNAPRYYSIKYTVPISASISTISQRALDILFAVKLIDQNGNPVQGSWLSIDANKIVLSADKVIIDGTAIIGTLKAINLEGVTITADSKFSIADLTIEKRPNNYSVVKFATDDTNSEIILPYWIEHNENNQATGYIWVKLPYNLNTLQSIKFYIQATSGYTPSGTNTFAKFCDFDSSSEITGDSYWKTSYGTYTVSNSKLTVTSGRIIRYTTNKTKYFYMKFDYANTKGYAINDSLNLYNDYNLKTDSNKYICLYDPLENLIFGSALSWSSYRTIGIVQSNSPLLSSLFVEDSINTDNNKSYFNQLYNHFLSGAILDWYVELDQPFDPSLATITIGSTSPYEVTVTNTTVGAIRQIRLYIGDKITLTPTTSLKVYSKTKVLQISNYSDRSGYIGHSEVYMNTAGYVATMGVVSNTAYMGVTNSNVNSVNMSSDPSYSAIITSINNTSKSARLEASTSDVYAKITDGTNTILIYPTYIKSNSNVIAKQGQLYQQLAFYGGKFDISSRSTIKTYTFLRIPLYSKISTQTTISNAPAYIKVSIVVSNYLSGSCVVYLRKGTTTLTSVTLNGNGTYTLSTTTTLSNEDQINLYVVPTNFDATASVSYWYVVARIPFESEITS